MMIECLTRRVGLTPVDIEGVRYNFFPIPGSKKGEQTTSVCEVNNEKHVEYLLHPRRGGTFREYDPERALSEMRAKSEKKNPMAGFSIQKYLESGYVVADYRDPKKALYAGSDGQWKEDRRNMITFPTEVQAYDWLKSELEYAEMDEGAEEIPEPATQPTGKGKSKG